MLRRGAIHILGLTVFFEFLNLFIVSPILSPSKISMVLLLATIGAAGLQQVRSTGTITVPVRRANIWVYIPFALFVVYTTTRIKTPSGVGTFVSYAGYFLLAVIVSELPRSKRDLATVIGYAIAASVLWGLIVVLDPSSYVSRPSPFGVSANVIARVVIYGIIFLPVYHVLSGRNLSLRMVSLVMAVLIAALIANRSRAGIIATAVFAAVYLSLRLAAHESSLSTKLKLVFGLSPVGLLGLVLAYRVQPGRFNRLAYFVLNGGDVSHMPNSSLAHRLHMVQFGWERFLERPLFGWGLDTFILATEASPAFEMPLDPHTTAVQVGSQLGLVGLLLVLWFLVALIRYTIRRTSNASIEDEIVFHILIAGSVLSIFLTVSYDVLRVAGFWLLIGVILSHGRLVYPALQSPRKSLSTSS